MTASVADEPWLKSPATRAVLTALQAEGGPDCVRFVGGCVRNTLMGQKVDDLDLATRLLPEVAMGALKKAGLKVVPTGLAHGTITAVSSGRPYEITTLRRDVETDGRKAVVAFTDDWAEDAGRRDFRLNALYADAEGQVFDPTGHGVNDAREGQIVFVGDPERRIREDYLRILRFFRFFAWYGRGEPDAAGLKACADLSEGLVRLSAERVSKELLKLLAARDPRPTVQAMASAGVLHAILPEAGPLAVFETMVDLSPDPVLRLSALLSPEMAQVEKAARRLRLANASRDRLIAAVGGEIDTTMDDRAARALIYRLGRPTFIDRVIRAQARSGGPGQGSNLIALAEAWPIPRLPVGGRQVAAAGLSAGPMTGRVLTAFEDSWIADDFPDHGHAGRLEALVETLQA
ncbi:MAG TPA: CCA tRNA nucleotidyltransferase [Brevundimonas sp.]|jgi:poly(A) polymerase